MTTILIAARPKRCTFSAEYKARILDEYDGLAIGSPERGVLLCGEGLYSSHRGVTQSPKTKIGRPRQIYTGLTERKYVPVYQR